ncbi:MAG: carbon storage regulator [Pirellulaceae bacterium]
MLVLSRRTNESIVIDDRITLEVLQIKGNQIRIGIKAPSSVRILRGELTPYGIDAGVPSDSEVSTMDLQIAQVG